MNRLKKLLAKKHITKCQLIAEKSLDVHPITTDCWEGRAFRDNAVDPGVATGQATGVIRSYNITFYCMLILVESC